MNKDQIKGATKAAVGEVQEQFGKIIGNKEQQAKGHLREMEGKAQKGLGDVRQAVNDAIKKP